MVVDNQSIVFHQNHTATTRNAHNEHTTRTKLYKPLKNKIMAKFYGTMVKTGRLGGSVFAIRNGVTIERQYQPNVSNPKSEAQTEARAKLKLISQLSEVVAPVIAIPREGLVSSRNLFVRRNYNLLGYENSTATCELEKIQLTGSVLALPALVVTPAGGAGGTISVSVGGNVSNEVTKMIYAYLVRNTDGLLRLRSAITVSVAGSTGNFPGTFDAGATSEGGVILAYGVKALTETARVKFSDINVDSAEQIAKLVATRVLTDRDVSMTETVGAIVTQNQ